MPLLWFISCSKNTSMPVVVSESSNAVVAESVSFKTHNPIGVNLSAGLNTLQFDSFWVYSDTVYISKMEFDVSVNDGQFGALGFKFYLNGGQVPATITLEGNVITVAMKKAIPLALGVHTYILQGKILKGHSGTVFNIVLPSAAIYNSSRVSVPIDGLPQVGNQFTIN